VRSVLVKEGADRGRDAPVVCDAGEAADADAAAVVRVVLEGHQVEPRLLAELCERWSVALDTADPCSRRVVADTVEFAGRSLAFVNALS
jgi:hypothetical protein